jgi:hypothetical protein
MKAREKLIIAVSLLACGISIAIFAVVSLGHFIYSPDRSTVPMVGKMYESTVEYVSVLKPLPVPSTTASSDDQNVKNAAQPTPTTPHNLQVDDKKLLKKNQLDVRHPDDKNKFQADSRLDYDNLRKTIASLLGLFN